MRLFLLSYVSLLLSSQGQHRQSRILLSEPWGYRAWHGNFREAQNELTTTCFDQDIELQIVTGDATKTCEDSVASIFSIGFDCDTALAELNGSVMRDFCCITCPTLQPSSAPSRAGTCVDNDDLLKYRMGYWGATCESELERITALGSSCTEQQIWSGKLEDFCCASCNGGIECVDDNSSLDSIFGPDLASCTALANSQMCNEPAGSHVVSFYCPVSCDLCPSVPDAESTSKPSVCDLFNTGSGEICDNIDFSSDICRILANFHTYDQNCDSFCNAHGTRCVAGWQPLEEGTCHGGTWIRRDCDYGSDGHICDCQDSSITLSPASSEPTYIPTVAPFTSSPSKQPTIAPTATSPSKCPTLAPTDSPTSSPTKSNMEIIRELQNTIRLQNEELASLTIEFETRSIDAQNICTQRFEQLESRLLC